MNAANESRVEPPASPRRLRRWQRVALWIVGVVAVYALLVGLALPPLAKHLVARKGGEQLGRTVVLDELSINPFTLAATATGFRILEPDGKATFVSFERLDLNASAASYYRLAPVVSALTLAGLQVSLVRETESRFNFSDIVDRLARAAAEREKAGEEEDEARFSIGNIRLVGARISLDDRPKDTKHEMAAIDLAIPLLSNLPTNLDEYVQPAFSAQLNGADMRLAGETQPFEDSLRTRFTVALGGVEIRDYLEYAPVLPFKVEGGLLDADIAVSFTQAGGKQPSIDIAGTLALREVAASVPDGPLAKFARLEAAIASFDPLAGTARVKTVTLRDASALGGEGRIPMLEARDIGLELRKRQARISSISTSDGALNLERSGDGSLKLPRFTPASGAAAAPPPGSPTAPAEPAGAAPASAKPAPAAQPWIVAIGKVEIANYQLALADAAVKPARTHRALLASLVLEELTTEKGLTGRGAMDLGVGQGGRLQATSTFTLEPLVVSATFDARGIDLVPLRPYAEQFPTVTLGSGKASAKGTATVRGTAQALQVAYRGTAEVAELATKTAGREDLLNWKSVRTSGIELDIAPDAPLSLAVAEVVVDRIYSRIVLNPDGTLNVQQLQEKAPAEPRAAARARPRAATPAQPRAAAPAASDPKPRNVRIGTVRFVEGRLNFTDLFIKPNYDADVGGLQGTVKGLSSDPASRATVDLRGRYDKASPVVISGTVNPLRGDLFLDIAAKGSDIALPPFTAYSQRYAGYGITDGKLTLDVKYHVEGGKMTGRNRIFVDQLTFGEKVESPDATKLPVLFAVNLLKDSKGQINLELPVSGSLDDPQFDISGLIAQVLGGLLKKAVTSPFSLLAAALGGGGSGGDAGGDDFAFVDFDAGASELGPAARKKLDTLAKALQDRPGLKLEVAGRVDVKKDGEAMRRAELERQLVEAKREALAAAGTPAKPGDTVTVDAAERPRYLRVLHDRLIPAKASVESTAGVAAKEPAKAPVDSTAGAAAKEPAKTSVESTAGAAAKDSAKEAPKGPTPAEMEAALLARITLADEQVKALAAARAEEAKRYLVDSGRLAADRVALGKAPDAGAAASRVDFTLR